MKYPLNDRHPNDEPDIRSERTITSTAGGNIFMNPAISIVYCDRRDRRALAIWPSGPILASLPTSELTRRRWLRRPVVLPPNSTGSMNMHGLALLGIYVVVALAGQMVGFRMSSLVERTVPWTGMPVFLAIFFGMIVLAWPVAVGIVDRLFPEPLKIPVRSRVV
jgi:hypothetical protein